jgi:hypothetical protein
MAWAAAFRTLTRWCDEREFRRAVSDSHLAGTMIVLVETVAAGPASRPASGLRRSGQAEGSPDAPVGSAVVAVDVGGDRGAGLLERLELLAPDAAQLEL